MSLFNYSEATLSDQQRDCPTLWFEQASSTPVQSCEPMSPSRVCDRCMVRKVKCNRQRPSCSRCAEEDVPCVYSSSKKRPGPVKGSRRKRPNTTATESDLDLQQQPSVSTVSASQDIQPSFSSLEDLLSQQDFMSLGQTPIFSEESCSVDQRSSNRGPLDPLLQPVQERQLLEFFFTYIQPSIPLFRKEPFLHRYEQGLVNRELLLTLVAVSAQIQGVATIWANPALKRCLDYLLENSSVEEETFDNWVSLEKFQQACLLAYFDFHQYPGKKAWDRISKLTRTAYQYDLDKVDNREQCQLYSRNSMTNEEAEEWRCLWWCIYCLDSYCNITAATPFVIELDSVRTALVQTSWGAEDQVEPVGAIFLPSETEMLWKTTKDIFSRPGDSSPNMHLVTTTLLREAGRLLRLWKQNPSDRLRARFTLVEDHLSAVRLALPARYLDVTRNVMVNESSSEHHARLVCILHLHAARLLISLPIVAAPNEAEWLRRWRMTLEHCEEVVAVVRQWKAQLCLSVDPAICFIISAVLMLLHLHSRDSLNTDPELQARLRTQKDMLLLFLQQFASIWHLPRFLIASFHKFTETFPGHFSATELDELVKKCSGMLRQSWFRTMSLTPNDFPPPIPQDFNRSVLSESNFGDWEFW